MQAHGHGGQPHECISKAFNSSVQRWPWIFQTITKSSRLEVQKDWRVLPPHHPHIRTRVLDCWLPVVGERLVLLFNSLFYFWYFSEMESDDKEKPAKFWIWTNNFPSLRQPESNWKLWSFECEENACFAPPSDMQMRWWSVPHLISLDAQIMFKAFCQ